MGVLPDMATHLTMRGHSKRRVQKSSKPKFAGNGSAMSWKYAGGFQKGGLGKGLTALENQPAAWRRLYGMTLALFWDQAGLEPNHRG